MNEKKRIYAVVGPTASGKSSFAINLAKKINAEIISMDSMQIYKFLDIGTAKLKEEEKENIKHHMIDIIEPNMNYSVSEYKNAVEKLISNILNRNKNVILCGGTGLYFESVIYDYTFSSFNKDDTLRKNLEELATLKGKKYLHNMLKTLDKHQAKIIHENNLKRVIRAIEIAKNSKDIKTNNQDKKNLKYDIVGYFLNPEREKLYQNINKRVDKMFEENLPLEINYLINTLKLNFSMQSMSAIGYREFKELENYNFDYEKIKDDIKKNTRHYAKRQITWFKRYSFLEEIK